MKRFYKVVTVVPSPERGGSNGEAIRGGVSSGFEVHLDGRPIKTPKRATLVLPTQTLAEAVAEEWRSQGEKINPAAMPFTKFANTAVDRVLSREAAVIDQIMGFANDHLCYRAASPQELVARQAAAWDPLLDWAAERFGARLKTGVGITHIAQPEEAVAALRRVVEAYDPFLLAPLHNAASIVASLVLTLAMAEGRLSAEEAFAHSQLDERYQAEHWGEDAEATARAQALAEELAVAERFMRLVKP